MTQSSNPGGDSRRVSDIPMQKYEGSRGVCVVTESDYARRSHKVQTTLYSQFESAYRVPLIGGELLCKCLICKCFMPDRLFTKKSTLGGVYQIPREEPELINSDSSVGFGIGCVSYHQK